ncbi:MAG: glycosyltransferase [Patescibacteria group bacterium]|nr:glycosyltransferase [Patescibacteria group bacterium]
MAEIQALILYCSLFASLFFEVFLLITYLEVREELSLEEQHLRKNIKWFPTVTIIVPCFNEEHTVDDTIQSLLSLDYPKGKLSIIAVDDGSTDETRNHLARFESHPQISVLSKNNGGKHTALNLGLEKVESDLVGCLDADSFVNSDALKKIVPFFDDASIMAVTPSIKVYNPTSVIQYVQKIEYSWGIFLRRMLSSLGALYVTPGPFSIFRTQVFRVLGGYRQAHHTEDLEIALRLQKNHYKIVNSYSAHVYTSAPVQFPALYKQRVRWAYGFLNNVMDYKEMFFNKKYGHIGLFILPIATSSIFSILYIAGRVLWNNLSSAFDALVKFQTVGFTWKSPTFDWFFINTGVVPFLTLSTIILTLVILYLSIKLAEGKFRFTKGIFYYLTIYIFIVPLWLTKAVFSTIFKRQINWR